MSEVQPRVCSRSVSFRLGSSVAVMLIAVHAFAATELQKFTDVRLVDSPANDGDSFIVQAGERQIHVRLYFVDCPETVARTDADAKRVREQARYFGITDAKRVFDFGREAKEFTAQALASPFTVYTAFASAGGRSPGGRVYAFVITSEGEDLGRSLVENGVGRAHGAKRAGPDKIAAKQIQQELQDLESGAMLLRKGIWAATEPEVIAQLRAEQRKEDSELKELQSASTGKNPAPASVDLNTATTMELQSISGIGPVLAARILANRPYKSVEDLRRVPGIGQKLLEKIRPYVVVTKPAEPVEVAH